MQLGNASAAWWAERSADGAEPVARSPATWVQLRPAQPTAKQPGTYSKTPTPLILHPSQLPDRGIEYHFKTSTYLFGPDEAGQITFSSREEGWSTGTDECCWVLGSTSQRSIPHSLQP